MIANVPLEESESAWGINATERTCSRKKSQHQAQSIQYSNNKQAEVDYGGLCIMVISV